MSDVVAPLRLEAWAVRGTRLGMGARALQPGTVPVVVAGVCGALDPTLRPGDLVVASEVRGDGEPIRCRTDIAATLGARVGPIVSTERLAGRERKRALAGTGALAVDMESYWLVASAAGRPVAVVRAVADRAGRGVLDPRTIPDGIRALLALRAARHVFDGWRPVDSPT